MLGYTPAELFVLVGHAHGFEVVKVSHGLEVAAADEEVDGDAFDALQVRHGGVDLVQLAMATSLHGDLHLGDGGGCPGVGW